MTKTVALCNGERVHITDFVREHSYVCTCPTHNKLIPVRGNRSRRSHFRFEPGASCDCGLFETSAEHQRGVSFIERALVAAGFSFVYDIADWEPGDRAYTLECVVRDPPEGGKVVRRSDILALYPNGTKVAFEIQKSKISKAELARRTLDHTRAGIYIAWIPVLPTEVCALGKETLRNRCLPKEEEDFYMASNTHRFWIAWQRELIDTHNARDMKGVEATIRPYHIMEWENAVSRWFYYKQLGAPSPDIHSTICYDPEMDCLVHTRDYYVPNWVWDESKPTAEPHSVKYTTRDFLGCYAARPFKIAARRIGRSQRCSTSRAYFSDSDELLVAHFVFPK